MRLGDFPGATISDEDAVRSLEWSGYIGFNTDVAVADTVGKECIIWLKAWGHTVAHVTFPSDTVYVAKEREL